jgi:hypothetical protein
LERAGRFVKAKPDSVKKLQDFAKGEAERKKKKDAEAAAAKKKPAGVQTGPSKTMWERLFGS